MMMMMSDDDDDDADSFVSRKSPSVTSCAE